MQDRLENFIRENRITEVECLIPDMSGIPRGKILPANKFLQAARSGGLRIPEAVLVQMVTGQFLDDSDSVTNPNAGDITIIPDANAMFMVPWYQEPTCQVICDSINYDGSPAEISTRQVLRRVLDLYAHVGWKPIVAPELEFYLVSVNKDPDYPLQPPVGLNGRQETGRQAYGIDAVNEFDPICEDIYDFCEAQGLDIDTLGHESGAGQIEINFNHGGALELADQVFVFKRTVRQAAFRKGIYATFMAKPMQGQPGSAMHIHQSIIDQATGRNIFTNEDGSDSDLLLWYIGGLQKFMPAAMPLVAPNVNSFKRLVPHADAPINVHWGRDNRTTSFRIPESGPQARRVENRIPGADANPYLAMAATLACGWLGIEQKIEPSDPITGSAYRLAHRLPQTTQEAIARFHNSRALREILGERFCEALELIKDEEYWLYNSVISAWERENLLLNV
jgi:glutamine synthetase